MKCVGFGKPPRITCKRERSKRCAASAAWGWRPKPEPKPPGIPGAPPPPEGTPEYHEWAERYAHLRPDTQAEVARARASRGGGKSPTRPGEAKAEERFADNAPPRTYDPERAKAAANEIMEEKKLGFQDPSPTQAPASWDKAAWQQQDYAQMAHAREVAENLQASQAEAAETPWWRRAWHAITHPGETVQKALITLGQHSPLARQAIVKTAEAVWSLTDTQRNPIVAGFAQTLQEGVQGLAFAAQSTVMLTRETITHAWQGDWQGAQKYGRALWHGVVQGWLKESARAVGEMVVNIVNPKNWWETGKVWWESVKGWWSGERGGWDALFTTLNLVALALGLYTGGRALYLRASARLQPATVVVESVESQAAEAPALAGGAGDEVAQLAAQYGDDVLFLVEQYGDDVLFLVEQYGDDVLRVVEGWEKAPPADVPPDWTARIANDAIALRATRALTQGVPQPVLVEAAQQMKMALLRGEGVPPLQEILPPEAFQYIDEIARAQVFGEGEHLIIGRYAGQNAGYIGTARAEGGLYYNTHPEVYATLKAAFGDQTGDVAWLINQRVLELYAYEKPPVFLNRNIPAEIEEVKNVWKNPSTTAHTNARFLEIRWLRLQGFEMEPILNEKGDTIGFQFVPPEGKP